MRSLLLPLGLVLSTSVLAQDKGFISGTAAFDSRTIDADGSLSDRTITTGTFGPAVGYNLSPVHVIGLSLSHTGTTEEYQEFNGLFVLDIKERRSLTTIAPFYRYMKSVNEKFLLYGQFKAGFGFGKETVEAGTTESEAALNTTDVRIGPGLVYLFADRWALSADWGVLGYYAQERTQETLSTDVVTTTSGFQASLDPANLSLALNWLF